MKNLFYKPDKAWLADVIPFYWNKEFHLFYLHDFRNKDAKGEGTPWYHLSTVDFLNFTEHGEAIERGTEQEQDLYVFTGCVLEADNLFHIFYTGHNPHFPLAGKAEQAVMHAVSEDLFHWKKIPEDTFFAPDGFEQNDWRDPFVFYVPEDKKYWMLLAARDKNGPHVRRGCTALCKSNDLRTWEVCPSLWMPEQFFTHECPDLFKMGDWWYLIFSEFTDKCYTRYRRSKSLDGPWIAPENDSFDGRAYYAAKTFSDQDKRYIFGWIPTRVEESDHGGWQWGGNLAVHEVYSLPDGTLGVKEPSSIRQSFASELPLHCQAFNGYMQKEEANITLSSVDGNATAVAEVVGEVVRVKMKMYLQAHTLSAGFILNYEESRGCGYGYIFDPVAQRVWIDKIPNHPWHFMDSRGLERPLKDMTERWIDISILLSHQIVVVYMDGQIALSFRMCEPPVGRIGFFVNNGTAIFRDIMIAPYS